MRVFLNRGKYPQRQALIIKSQLQKGELNINQDTLSIGTGGINNMPVEKEPGFKSRDINSRGNTTDNQCRFNYSTR